MAENPLFETPQYKTYEEAHGDILAKLLVVYQDKGNIYRQFETKLAAADGDKEAAIKNWMDTAEDTQAAKLRTQIENATNKLRELAEKSVTTEELSETDREKIRTEMDALRVELKAGEKSIQELPQMLGLDSEGLVAELAKIGNPAKSPRGRKAGEAGSKLPRTSVNITVNGGNLKDQKYPSFSPLAQILHVDVKDLQLAFAKAAGVNHEDIKSVKDPVEFTFQPNDNGAVYTIHTEPKERKPRESKTETEASADGPVSAPDFESVGK